MKAQLITILIGLILLKSKSSSNEEKKKKKKAGFGLQQLLPKAMKTLYQHSLLVRHKYSHSVTI